MFCSQIFIVDGQEDLLEQVKESIETRQYTLNFTDKLETALKFLKPEIDLVITGLRIKEDWREGLEVIRKARDLEIPCGVITETAPFKVIKETVNIGVHFIVEKPFETISLLSHIEEFFGNNALKSHNLRNFSSKKSFTKRESEIFVLACQGLSISKIANRFQITERTVKAHLSAIYKKTGSHNRYELMGSFLSDHATNIDLAW